jgi:3-deoxy-7-phosphoheptulonate synthase
MIERKELLNNLVNPNGFNIIAGPCTIESRESLDEMAAILKEMNIRFIRGGAYKMRTSPQSFRGLGDIALSYLKEAGERHGLLTISECIDINKVELMSESVDVLLVGTRNMYNYPLLEKLGSVKNPIILKRGMSSTYNEWLLAASYIVEAGNPNVVLCERGIRTFETYTRNTLDLSSIPAVKTMSSYPVIVDPSHSTGRQDMIKSMTWAAVAAGANGIMIETHLAPSKSLCDANQAITPEQLKKILEPLNILRKALNI